MLRAEFHTRFAHKDYSEAASKQSEASYFYQRLRANGVDAQAQN